MVIQHVEDEWCTCTGAPGGDAGRNAAGHGGAKGGGGEVHKWRRGVEAGAFFAFFLLLYL
jgi:hypothetical protein